VNEFVSWVINWLGPTLIGLFILVWAMQLGYFLAKWLENKDE
jgi:hypothetical protein